MNSMATVAELTTKESPTWCAGCGDYTILSTLKNAISDLQLEQKDTVIVSGIGCGSKAPHFVNVYGFESLHGRILPVATAIKLCNHKLNVICIGGDGDGYGIGAGHFMHAMRRNFNMIYIVQNNEVYGLTKGQYSPTSPSGFKSPTTPLGAIDEPVNPLAWAIAAGATFVARGYNMDLNHLKKIFIEGIKHKGFSLIDTFQLCPTYNKINSMAFFKTHLYKLEDEGYAPDNKFKAFEKAYERDGKIPIGVFYKEEGKPTYEGQVEAIKEKPLVDHDLSKINVKKLLEKFM